MKKKYIIGGVVVLVLIGIIAVMAGSGEEEAKEVTIKEVQKRTIKEVVTASGKIFPETEVKISSDVSGEIIELDVEEGDSVRQGQILAKIDPDAYQFQVERAEAQLNSSKAQLANSKANVKNLEANVIQSEAQLKNIKAQLENASVIYERNKKLNVEKMISDADLDLSYANMEALKANLSGAEASILSAKASLEGAKESVKASNFSVKSSSATLSELKTSLKRTTLYAPISGIVSMKNVEKGERVVGTIQMTGTELLRIANLNIMEVKVEVSESDVVKVKLQDKVSIEVDAYRDRKFEGEVVLIANSASNAAASELSINNDQVTNFYVTIRIDENSYKDLSQKGYPFRPGMSATVEINTATAKDVVSVPIQAVTLRDLTPDDEDNTDTEVVFVQQADSVIVTPVKIGIQDNRFIYITEGLNVGDKIVTGPYSAISKELETGDKVKEKEEKEDEK